MTTAITQEQWLIIPEYPEYGVSSAGRVYSITHARLVPSEGSGDAATVALIDSVGRTHQRNLRALVLSVFGHVPQEHAELQKPEMPPATTGAAAVSTPSPVPFGGKDPDGVVTDIAWRSVTLPDTAPGYQVSELGEVISPQGNLLKPGIHRQRNGDTTLWVSLARSTEEGKYYRARLDRVVALAFLGPPPSATSWEVDVEDATKQYTVRHINGDTQDCRAENLTWEANRTAKTPARNKKKTHAAAQGDGVEVVTTTVYRYGGVEVVEYPDGRWVHPPMTPDNAAALARIFAEIGQRKTRR